MALVLVGSLAAKLNGVDLGREPLDEDYICSKQEFRDLILGLRSDGAKIRKMQPTTHGQAVFLTTPDGVDKIIEAEFTDGDNPTALAIHNLVVGEWDGMDVLFVAGIDVLYMLKMSHRFKKNTPHFLKTMRDIHILRAAGAQIPDQELYELREAWTYSYGHPSLAVDKKNFFVNLGELEYVYDHDSIHAAVAHKDRPMYTYYAMDGEEVKSDRTKFEALPYQERLWGVLEESYVLALERSVIPHDSNPNNAFMMALEKVCTSITSGWFREFAWENYYAVLEQYDPDYVRKFKIGLMNGVVKPYDG